MVLDGMKSFSLFIILSTKKKSEFRRMVLQLYAPPFLMRVFVELYDKVPGEYHANGVSTSSRFRLIEAVPGTMM
jgi:hypothetical protein